MRILLPIVMLQLCFVASLYAANQSQTLNNPANGGGTVSQQASAQPLTPPSPPQNQQEAMENADRYLKQLDQRMDSMMKDDPFFSGGNSQVKNPGVLNNSSLSPSDFPQIRYLTKNKTGLLIFIVPGMDKSNISVQLNNRDLVVSGKYTNTTTVTAKTEQKDGIVPAADVKNDQVTSATQASPPDPQQVSQPDDSQLIEHVTREFAQKVTLPENCDPSKISSKYNNGMLTIIIPLTDKNASNDTIIPIN